MRPRAGAERFQGGLQILSLCRRRERAPRNAALWNAGSKGKLTVEGPERVNSRRSQGCSQRPLCPPNQTTKSALMRVRRTNGSFQENFEANSKNKCLRDKRLAEAVRHPLVASTPTGKCGRSHRIATIRQSASSKRASARLTPET
jgi:hypothetical protein